MTSISTLNNGGYYQLSNPLAGTGTGQAPNATDALLQAMSAASNSSFDNSNSNNDAFLLDLSPEAQGLLNGGGAPSTSGLAGLLNGGNFALSAKQQEQITAILTKYKDAPYTQDTFNQIQNDLNAAGLGPQLLSMEDQAKSFDPALVLLDALNGTDSTLSLSSATDEQDKATAYMQSIISQWKSISSIATTTSAA